MRSFILVIDRLNAAIGKGFSWFILVLALGVSYEVIVRYVFNDPTTWAYDISYNMYGALFIMAGGYTLSRNAHVRADMAYRLLKPRVQAGIDLVLYLTFFFPGVLALCYAGFDYAARSWRYHEVSVYSPTDIPIFPLKTLIPVAGATLAIQGLAELMRCIICLREGAWPVRMHDVEEMETMIRHEREYVAGHDVG